MYLKTLLIITFHIVHHSPEEYQTLTPNCIEPFNNTRAVLASKKIAYRISLWIRAIFSIIKTNDSYWENLGGYPDHFYSKKNIRGKSLFRKIGLIIINTYLYIWVYSKRSNNCISKKDKLLNRIKPTKYLWGSFPLKKGGKSIPLHILLTKTGSSRRSIV